MWTESASRRRPRRAVRLAVLLPALAALVGCVPRPYWNTPTPLHGATPSPTPILVTMVPTAALSATPQPTASPAITGPTTLRTEPLVTLGLAVGETRLVQVWIDNAQGLHGVELHIGFEPRYVHIEDADPASAGVQVEAGSIPAPAQVVRNDVDNTAGLVVYHVVQAEESAPAMGSGMVAALTVRGQNEGGSPLRFNVVRLFGVDGQLLASPAQVDGLIEVGAGATPGAVTEQPTPAPTDTPTVPTSTAGTPSPSPQPATPASGALYHTVQAGENLFRIALRYGVPMDTILEANHMSDADALQVGQVLLIPSASTVTYVVQQGDTLYSIAQRHGTTVDALVSLNGLASPDAISTGQVLVIVP